MKPLRLAVVGAGHLGRIHARLARNLEGAELVAVADPVAAARQDVAAETGATPYENFLDLVGRIDAAIVATPTWLHHSVAMPLLRAGIHLLVEKPLAASVDEADEMVAAAEAAGVVLQTGHVERFNPALCRVLPHLTEPKYIDAVRISGYPFRSTDIGVVLDLMIHDLDIALSLADSPVKEVSAMGISILGRNEDAANARVVFENGCVANFSASRVSYRAERSMQVWSSQSFASIDFGMRTTTVVHPDEDVLRRKVDVDGLPAERQQRLRGHMFDDLLVKEKIEGAEGNALADEQRDLVASICEGRAPRVTGAAGRDALALAEEILRAIERHAWDGSADGRIGPFAAPHAPILRGPHWRQSEQPARHKQAG
jgi:predicted dehydrogenase